MNVILFVFLFVFSVHFLWNALILLGYLANFYSSFETYVKVSPPQDLVE